MTVGRTTEGVIGGARVADPTPSDAVGEASGADTVCGHSVVWGKRNVIVLFVPIFVSGYACPQFVKR